MDEAGSRRQRRVAKLWFDVATARLGGSDATPSLASALLKEELISKQVLAVLSFLFPLLIIIGPHRKADIAPGPCKSIL